ncbi:hypothetical protein D1007_40609 [Hordeum vulgare]|nr:hypothetical protein D1007_40609 [Hordeum vulgare]
MAGRFKVYYCAPILTLSDNGLRELSHDEQTDRMLLFVDIGHHSFSIYLDHDESLKANLNEDDVVNYPRATLPPVISPARRVASRSTIETEQSEVIYPEVYAEEDAEADGNVDVHQFEFVRRLSTQQHVAETRKIIEDTNKTIVAERKAKQEAERRVAVEKKEAEKRAEREAIVARKEEQKKLVATEKAEEKRLAVAQKEEKKRLVAA